MAAAGVATPPSWWKPYCPWASTVIEVASDIVPKLGHERFLTWCDAKGNEETTLTFKEFWDRAEAIAVSIADYRGERVLCCFAPGAEFFWVFWGCLRAEVTAVPVYPPDPTKLEKAIVKLGLIRDACGARLCLTDDTVNLLRLTKGLFYSWPQQLEWRTASSLSLEGRFRTIRWPQLWMMLASRYVVECAVAPDFAYRLVARRLKNVGDLSCLRCCVTAAERVREGTYKELKRVLEPFGFRATIIAAYGLAESVVCVCNTLGIRTSKVRPDLVCCGTEFLVDIRIVDPETKTELPDATPGEIWVSSGSVAGGYWGKDSDDIFRADLGGGRKYLRTGDEGFIEDGGLYICGRRKDMIIVQGENYYADDVEIAAQDAAQDEVRPGCIAAFAVDNGDEEDLVIVYEIRKGKDATAVGKRVSAAVTRDVGLAPARLVAIEERSILKTTSGKIQRRATRDALLAGNLKVVDDTFLDKPKSKLSKKSRGPDEVIESATEDNSSSSTELNMPTWWKPYCPGASTVVEVARDIVPRLEDERFLTWCDAKGNEETTLTFKEFWDRTEAVATSLADYRGERVMCCFVPGAEFFSVFWGCLRAVVTAVPVYPPDPSKLEKAIAKLTLVRDACGARLCLTDNTVNLLRLTKGVFYSWPKNLEWRTTRSLSARGSVQNALPSSSFLAFLQFTSGTTGDPKGVMISHANLKHNVCSLCIPFNQHGAKDSPRERSSGISWLPGYHDMGLIYAHIMPYCWGAEMVYMSPLTFLSDPELWMRLASRYGVEFTTSPDFGYRLVARRLKNVGDLSSLIGCMTAAERVRESTYKELRKVLEPFGFNAIIVPAYGLAESVVGVCVTWGVRTSKLRPDLVCCGTEFLVDIRIVDPETRTEQPHATPGEIWVSSDSVAGGYWGKDSDDIFRADLGGGRKYLRTGDEGFIEDGGLYICGRRKDMIIVQGENYYADDVEIAAQDAAQDEVRPGCIAAFAVDDGDEEDLVIVYEIRKGKDAAAVARRVSAAVHRGVGLRPKRLVAIEERSILKTTSGKVRRRATRDALLAGNLNVVDDALLEEQQSKLAKKKTTRAVRDEVTESSTAMMKVRSSSSISSSNKPKWWEKYCPWASTVIEVAGDTVPRLADKRFLTWCDAKGNEETTMTFKELWDRAETIGMSLEDYRGEKVLCCFAPGAEFFGVFWGCLRAFVTAVPVYPPDPSKLEKAIAKLGLIRDACGARLCLSDDTVNLLRLTKGLFYSWPQNLEWRTTRSFSSSSSSSSRGSIQNAFESPSFLAFLQFTSGTTGDPKGVMISHANLNHNVCSVCIPLNQHSVEDSPRERSSGISWLPGYHDMGLIYAHIVPFCWGAEMVYMSPLTFLAHPELWMTLASRYRVEFTTSPDFGYRLVARRLKKVGDLSSLCYMMTAAERVRESTYEELRKVLEPFGFNATIVPAYGLAESVVGVCVTWGVRTSKLRPDLVCCGTEFLVDIRIVDPETRTEQPHATPGEIWVSSDSVAGGYWGKDSDDIFRADLGGGRKYLRTGDEGFIEDGGLYICGRRKDMIIVQGENYYADDVEIAAQDAAQDEVRPGCIAAFAVDDGDEEDLVIVYEIRKGKDAAAVARRVSAAVTHGVGLAPKRLVAIEERSILKTTSGKIRRRATRDALLAGSLKVVDDTLLEKRKSKLAKKSRACDEVTESATAMQATPSSPISSIMPKWWKQYCPWASTVLEVAGEDSVPRLADERFLTWCDAKGNEETTMTFKELWDRAEAIAVSIADYRGERVLCCFVPGAEFFGVFWGCLRAEVTAVPVYPPDPTKLEKAIAKLGLIRDACGARLCLTDDTVNLLRLTKGLFYTWPQHLEWRTASSLSARGSLPDDPVASSFLAFLQFTSGTTGDPKGVMISHANLNHNVCHICIPFQQGCRLDLPRSRSSAISWLPGYHDMGLILAHISPFCWGCEMVYMSPLTFLSRPELWMTLASRYRVEFTTSPDFGYRLVVKRLKIVGDLSSLRCCMTAAERVREGTYKELARVLEPFGFRARILPSYGLAESVVAVCGAKDIRTSKLRPDLVCCGTEFLVDIRIVDPETKTELPDATPGEIWVSSGSVAGGYWGKDSDDIFRADLGSRKYLRTGDEGFIEDGGLYICGRRKDMIIVQGENYYADDVEIAAQDAAQDEVRPGCIAAFAVDNGDEEDLVIVYEIRKGKDTSAVAKRVSAAVTHDVGLAPKRLVAIEERSILKTTSGKVRRRATRDALLAGSLNVVKDTLLEKPQTFQSSSAAISMLSSDAALDIGDDGQNVDDLWDSVAPTHLHPMPSEVLASPEVVSTFKRQLLVAIESIDVALVPWAPSVRSLADSRFFGLRLSPRCGGHGLSWQGMAEVTEFSAIHDLPFTAYWTYSSVLGFVPIELYGSKQAKRKYGAMIARGNLVSFAMTEAAAGSDFENIESLAEKLPDGAYRVRGTKTWIFNAPHAAAFVVFARADGGMTGFVLDASQVSLAGGKHTHGHRAIAFGTLVFDAVVPPENVLSCPDGRPASCVATDAMCLARFAFMPMLCGVAKRCFAFILEAGGDSLAARSALTTLLYRIEAADNYHKLMATMLDDGLPLPFEASYPAKVLGIEWCCDAAETLSLVISNGYDEKLGVCQLLSDVRAFRILEGSSNEALTSALGRAMLKCEGPLYDFVAYELEARDLAAHMRAVANSPISALESAEVSCGAFASVVLVLAALKKRRPDAKDASDLLLRELASLQDDTAAVVTSTPVGFAKRCCAMAQDFAQRRWVEGGLLSSKIETKLKLARLADGIVAVNALTTLLASKCDAGAAVPCAAFLACHLVAPKLACDAADALTQILGSRGYDEDTGIPAMLRDSYAFRFLGGTRLAIADALGRNCSALHDFIATELKASALATTVREAPPESVASLATCALLIAGLRFKGSSSATQHALVAVNEAFVAWSRHDGASSSLLVARDLWWLSRPRDTTPDVSEWRPFFSRSSEENSDPFQGGVELGASTTALSSVTQPEQSARSDHVHAKVAAIIRDLLQLETSPDASFKLAEVGGLTSAQAAQLQGLLVEEFGEDCVDLTHLYHQEVTVGDLAKTIASKTQVDEDDVEASLVAKSKRDVETLADMHASKVRTNITAEHAKSPFVVLALCWVLAFIGLGAAFIAPAWIAITALDDAEHDSWVGMILVGVPAAWAAVVAMLTLEAAIATHLVLDILVPSLRVMPHCVLATHSPAFVAWWFLQRILQMNRFLFLEELRRTPLLAAYLRLVGARVEGGVVLDSVHVRDPHLVSLGARCQVDAGAVIEARRFEPGHRQLAFDRVVVGSRAHIATRCVVKAGVRLPSGFQLAPLDVVRRSPLGDDDFEVGHNFMEGSKKQDDTDDEEDDDAAMFRRLVKLPRTWWLASILLIYLKLVVLSAAAVPSFLCLSRFFVATGLYPPNERIDPLHHGGAEAFAIFALCVHVSPIYLGLAPIVVDVDPEFARTEILKPALSKWRLLGAAVPVAGATLLYALVALAGVAAIARLLRPVKKCRLVADALADCVFWRFGWQFGHGPVMSWWYQLLGARVGAWATIRQTFERLGHPEHLTIGQNAHIGDNAILDARGGELVVKDNAILGFGSVVIGRITVPDTALVAGNTAVLKDTQLRSGSLNIQSFQLRRASSSLDDSLHSPFESDRHSESIYALRWEDASKRAEGTVASNIDRWLVYPLSGFAAPVWALATLLVAAYVALRASLAFLERWERPRVAVIIYHLTFLVVASFIVVANKRLCRPLWGVLGRRTLESSRHHVYGLSLARHAIADAPRAALQRIAAFFFADSPANVWLARGIGVAVGRNVILGTADVFFEADLLKLEDGCVIEERAMPYCHALESSRLSYGPVVIGTDAVVETGAITTPFCNLTPTNILGANKLGI
ncbi:hypothetical protein CTAYLR_006909 [Chrysophaeum taylorii]|uniref:Uncharacterized protein n=1 Tax=Chrysophaeum taylorii TaxID=2483200 RepID=A0AAD7U970_9STRA|nr:hypothetical protein CTAYLR_006909 [Chrysophaeum taylorii]